MGGSLQVSCMHFPACLLSGSSLQGLSVCRAIAAASVVGIGLYVHTSRSDRAVVVKLRSICSALQASTIQTACKACQVLVGESCTGCSCVSMYSSACSHSAARSASFLSQRHISICVVQGRLWPRTDDERKKALEAGYDVKQVCVSFRQSLCPQRPCACAMHSL